MSENTDKTKQTERGSDRATAACYPQKVKLLKCGKKTCSHVLTEDEQVWIPSDMGRSATCPKCGKDSFYSLNELGQEVTWNEREKYREGVNVDDIVPSERMGLKMKRRILRAKRHAYEILA